MIKSEESCDSQKDLLSSGETENAPEASIKMEVEVSNMILKKINSRHVYIFKCGTTISTAQRLVQHKRTHTGEKHDKCSECDEAFHKAGNLK